MIRELSFGAGQGELKYRASKLIRIRPQPAPVSIDDGPADRQPHPHSAGLRGVEGIENALDMFRIGAIGAVARKQRRSDRTNGCSYLHDLFDGRLRAGPSEVTGMGLDQRLFARDDDAAHPALSLPALFRLRASRASSTTAIFSPFSIFLLRTYFLAIPREIEEAAIMDGANRWQVFATVCLPLVSPGILTVAVIYCLNTWNEFLVSSTFLQSHDRQTAVVRFYTLGGQYTSDWGEIMAAGILIVAPALIFFLIVQRRFIEGVASGGQRLRRL